MYHAYMCPCTMPIFSVTRRCGGQLQLVWPWRNSNNNVGTLHSVCFVFVVVVVGQVSENRSAVAREACRCVAVLARSLTDHFGALAELWLPELLRNTTRAVVVAAAGDEAARAIFGCVSIYIYTWIMLSRSQAVLWPIDIFTLRSTFDKDTAECVSSVQGVSEDLIAKLKTVRLRVNAHRLCFVFFRCTKDGFPRLLPYLIDTVKNKSAAIRRRCLDYAMLALARWSDSAFDRYVMQIR